MTPRFATLFNNGINTSTLLSMASAASTAMPASSHARTPSTSNTNTEQLSEALSAAYSAQHKRYTLLPEQPFQKIKFLVFGCQGNAKDEQKQVAQLMDALAAESCTPNTDNILFYLVLGDNFYDDGVDSADDNIFNTHFYRIYGNHLTVPHLATLPAFIILGNHDEGRYAIGQYKNKAGLGKGSGVQLGMNQVAHTYLGDTDAKNSMYENDQLHLNTLPQWNMPSRYYSLIIGNLEIFLIDSNTYASDFFESRHPANQHDNNQAYWLKTNVNAARKAGRTVMLAQHHPLFTPGKRAFNSDISLYLDETQIDFARNHFPTLFEHDKPSFNTLLWEIFKQQSLCFDTVFAAHDHSLSYFNNAFDSQTNPANKLCQIISAGAGGSLQQRRYFKQQDHTGIFMKKHGAVCVEYDPSNQHDIRYTFLTARHRLQFSSQDINPIQSFTTEQTPAEREAILRFLQTIKTGIDDYFHFWDQRQQDHKGRFQIHNVTHGDEGIDRAHNLWTHISDTNTTAQSLDNIVTQVAALLSGSGQAEHSLITRLNVVMQIHYGMTLREYQYQQQTQQARVKNMASP